MIPNLKQGILLMILKITEITLGTILNLNDMSQSLVMMIAFSDIYVAVGLIFFHRYIYS